MSKHKVMVNASDVGKAAYCPHALSLQSRPNSKPGEAARRGTQAHDGLNHYLLNGGDKRCFVATYALGEQHPTTHALRVWRDRALKPYVCGRLLVAAYYWLSPILISLAGSSPWCRRVAAKLVKGVARCVVKHA